MKKSKGKCLIWLGLLLMAAALCLTGYNVWDAFRAEKSVRQTADRLEALISPAPEPQPENTLPEEILYPDYVLNPEMEMPEEDVDEGFAIEDLLALMGLDEDVRNSLASQTQEKIQDTGVSLVMAVVESLAQSILYAALFLVSVVGLTILLKLLIRAMGLVLQLPGLHLVNALGGAVIGLIEGALVLFLAIWVLRRFGVSFETDTVSATHILRFFATHTPLSALSLLQ